MKEYIYPQNLKAQAQLWLWRLKDLTILGAALLVSVLALSQLKFFLPLAVTLMFAFLTMRFDRQQRTGLYPRGGSILYYYPAILCVETTVSYKSVSSWRLCLSAQHLLDENTV